ncbi:sensor histidine kinase [Streptomyces sp. NPDC093223]|uniref:ATP-binding protein n=1 Tax=Streptomyces sp. NPDC093223 TaxID=3366033 RepID=UPI003823C699
MTRVQRSVAAVTVVAAALLCGALAVARDGVDLRSVALITAAWSALAAAALTTARRLARGDELVTRLTRELERAREDRGDAEAEVARLRGDLRIVRERTLPAAVEGLRAGAAAQSVSATITWPHDAGVRALAETILRDIAHSERRFTAARTASTTALGRVQARTVRLLADLRDMQDRHDEAALGDLMHLDHTASQIGLLTDRLAVLMGGRSSRTWNRPIAVESVLRGAVGRIAAYRRVRLRASSSAHLSGHAAEGLMHLLAELIDNAANFSPPTEPVHVRVREETEGLFVTVEDQGLRMAGAALRYANSALTAEGNDLAALRGTRLGLAVVGRLSARFGIAVDFQVPARGGTTVVVRVPRKLLVREPGGAGAAPARTVAAGSRTGGPAHTGTVPPLREKNPSALGPSPAAPRTTMHGLPVRTRGASAGRRQEQRLVSEPGPPTRVRGAGASFRGFHQSLQTGRRSGSNPPEVADPPCE